MFPSPSCSPHRGPCSPALLWHGPRPPGRHPSGENSFLSFLPTWDRMGDLTWNEHTTLATNFFMMSGRKSTTVKSPSQRYNWQFHKVWDVDEGFSLISCGGWNQPGDHIPLFSSSLDPISQSLPCPPTNPSLIATHPQLPFGSCCQFRQLYIAMQHKGSRITMFNSFNMFTCVH